ncbi:MAG: hypothetical protein QOG64_888, partial [Acidimicrobiaceae bacterium]|nr:hypothetical protein [Acidimicrobiaceae bacterium]
MSVGQSATAEASWQAEAMASRLVSPVFVGRRAQLNQFTTAFAAAAAGQPRFVLVAGDAGVGKSRFAREATSSLESAGVRVLWGSCVELGGEGAPFVSVVDALRQLARTTPAPELDRLLGPARRDLARLLPELGPDAADPVDAGLGTTARLFELILGLVGRLAERAPLVVVIEDVHWADPSTLDLLGFLARALRSESVLLVATYRADEIHRQHPLRRLLVELERLPGAERIDLPRFTRAEVVEQLHGIVGERPAAGIVDAVFQRSEGNAFFVEELIAADPEQHGAHLPPGLRDVLLARIDGLPKQTQRVLHAIAAAGQPVSHPLLLAVTGMAHADLDDALRDAVTHRVLAVHEPDDTYGYRHALAREAVYDDILPGERVRLHVAYGDGLEAGPNLGGPTATPAAMLAFHWYAAHDVRRALPATVEAGRQAAHAYAFVESAQHFERAIETWNLVEDAPARTGIDLVDLLALAADARERTVDPIRATALLDEALTLIENDPDPDRAALLLTRRGRIKRDSDPDDAFADLHEAARLLPADSPRLPAVLASIAATALLSSNDVEKATQFASEAAAAARAAGDDRQLADALVTLGSAQFYGGDRDAGAATMHEALRLALEINDDETTLRAYINLSDLLGGAARFRESADAARAGLDLAKRVGLYRREGIFAAINLAEALLMLGDWDEAEAVITEAMANASGMPNQWVIERYLDLTVGRRDLDAARPYLGSADQLQPQMRAGRILNLAEVARLEGRLIDARHILARGLGFSALGPRYVWAEIWLAVRIEADLAQHRRHDQTQLDPEHRDRLDALAAIARTLPTDLVTLHAYRELAVAEHRRATGEADPDQWHAAAQAWRQAGEPPRLAYALFRL